MAYKKRNTGERIPVKSPLEKLLGILLLLFSAALIVAAYGVIRRTAIRVSSDFYFPFLKAARETENMMADSSLMLEDKKTLAKALLKLRQEKFQLIAERAAFQDALQENRKLRDFLKIRARGSFHPVFAQLLYRNETSSETTFLLDKGENAGIRPGDIVVAPVRPKSLRRTIVAVAGRVEEVSRHTCTVSNFYSRDFRLNVTFAGITGILKNLPGVEAPLTGITFIPVNTAIRKGEFVFTGSLTPNTPPGLPVGTIESLRPKQTGIDRDHVYQETCVKPFVNPGEIRFAAVYVRKVPQKSGNLKRKQTRK